MMSFGGHVTPCAGCTLISDSHTSSCNQVGQKKSGPLNDGEGRGVVHCVALIYRVRGTRALFVKKAAKANA